MTSKTGPSSAAAMGRPEYGKGLENTERVEGLRKDIYERAKTIFAPKAGVEEPPLPDSMKSVALKLPAMQASMERVSAISQLPGDPQSKEKAYQAAFQEMAKAQQDLMTHFVDAEGNFINIPESGHVILHILGKWVSPDCENMKNMRDQFYGKNPDGSPKTKSGTLDGEDSDRYTQMDTMLSNPEQWLSVPLDEEGIRNHEFYSIDKTHHIIRVESGKVQGIIDKYFADADPENPQDRAFVMMRNTLEAIAATDIGNNLTQVIAPKFRASMKSNSEKRAEGAFLMLLAAAGAFMAAMNLRANPKSPVAWGWVGATALLLKQPRSLFETQQQKIASELAFMKADTWKDLANDPASKPFLTGKDGREFFTQMLTPEARGLHKRLFNLSEKQLTDEEYFQLLEGKEFEEDDVHPKRTFLTSIKPAEVNTKNVTFLKGLREKHPDQFDTLIRASYDLNNQAAQYQFLSYVDDGILTNNHVAELLATADLPEPEPEPDPAASRVGGFSSS